MRGRGTTAGPPSVSEMLLSSSVVGSFWSKSGGGAGSTRAAYDDEARLVDPTKHHTLSLHRPLFVVFWLFDGARTRRPDRIAGGRGVAAAEAEPPACPLGRCRRAASGGACVDRVRIIGCCCCLLRAGRLFHEAFSCVASWPGRSGMEDAGAPVSAAACPGPTDTSLPPAVLVPGRSKAWPECLAAADCGGGRSEQEHQQSNSPQRI